MSANLHRAPLLSGLAVLLVSLSACTTLGGVLDELGTIDGRGSVLDGELRSLDTRRGRLEVRETYGRTHTVRYDSRTQAVYRQRQIDMTALKRGDVVRVRLSRDRNGTEWADRVELRQSTQDRELASGRVVRVEGAVSQADVRRGTFVLQPDRSQALLVYMPRGARSEDVRRFERLRRGERVRADIRAVGRNQAELVRFR